MTRTLLVLAIASLTLVPAAAAAPPGASGAGQHWALAWAHFEKAEATAAATGDIVCELGDLDADGVDDILLRAHDDTTAKLVAVSGDGGETLWESTIDAAATLECAPDVAGDGVADPLLLLDEATGDALPDGAPVSTEDAIAHLRALDGATGEDLLSLEAAERATGGDATAVSGSTTASAALQPGGEGIYLFVKTEETSAATELLDRFSLSSGDTSLEIEVIDAEGNVLSTIKTAPEADVLGHAVVADADTATVLLLTATDASPIDQVPARVPSVSAFDTDGTLRWSVELASRTDELMLVPDAGDLDADGVSDLIVETAPGDLGLPGASSLSVLSGADGSVLFERTSESGLLAALPFGDLTPDDLTDGDALLVVTQATADAGITIECVRDGETCWTAELPVDAIPVNADTDAFTGDIGGFEDLTGDGVPDIATLVEGDGAATLAALDGVDGTAAWSTTIDASSQVLSVAREDGADLAVLGALDESARTIDVSLIDGATGELDWTATATVDETLEDATATLTATADGESLLLTIGGENAYALDTATGATQWTGAATIGAEAPEPLALSTASSDTSGIAQVPAPGVGLLVGVGVLVALVARRRRA